MCVRYICALAIGAAAWIDNVSFENAFNNIDRVMRNDEGLASELDYAEQTSWLLFLKYLDDLETERADRAALEGRDYTPILVAPFRWGTWAAPKKDGQFDHQAAMTGADLIEFVNNQLWSYLRKFRDSAISASAHFTLSGSA